MSSGDQQYWPHNPGPIFHKGTGDPWVRPSPYAREAIEIELARCEREVNNLTEKMGRLRKSLEAKL